MEIDILNLAEILGAVLAVGGAIWTVFKFIEKVNRLDGEVKEIKKEDALICYSLHACLDGLEQLGANHTVPVAKEKLEKYLNIQAHQ